MSDTEKKDDVVEATKYNEAIEKINSEKIQKEKLEKELKELKTKTSEDSKTAESDAKIAEAKQVWEKEAAEKDKMIADLKAKVETKDDTKVSKGIVKDAETKPKQNPQELKEKLNEELGELPKSDPRNFNRWDKYGHFKNSKTKLYNDEQFGKALSLHEGAVTAGQAPLNDNQKDSAKRSKDDIVLNRNSDTITEGQI